MGFINGFDPRQFRCVDLSKKTRNAEQIKDAIYRSLRQLVARLRVGPFISISRGSVPPMTALPFPPTSSHLALMRR